MLGVDGTEPPVLGHGGGMLHRMNALILAVESTSPPGDDLQVLALALAGIAMVVAGVAAAIVTPRAEHHDH